MKRLGMTILSIFLIGISKLDATKIKINGTWTNGECQYNIQGWVDVNLFTGTVNCYSIVITSNDPKCGSGKFETTC